MYKAGVYEDYPAFADSKITVTYCVVLYTAYSNG